MCQCQEPARPAMRRCGTGAKHAGVPLRRVRAVEGAGRLFSTPSKPALRAAACGGRPRADNDTTITGTPTSPSIQGGPVGESAIPEVHEPVIHCEIIDN
jgi:hypothetical protein